MFTVYKTTNKINNKWYIGVHETDNPMDNYLGSGEAITAAKKKYGSENFSKEILFIFEDIDEAYDMERKLVTKDTIKDPLCYNKVIGGTRSIAKVMHRCASVKTRLQEHARANSKKIQERYNNDPEFRKIIEGNLNKARKAYAKKVEDDPELRNLLSERNSGTQSPSHGSFWINDGTNNKIMKKDSAIPEGWVLGRIMPWNDNRKRKRGDTLW
jgi:hypothetical protein